MMKRLVATIGFIAVFVSIMLLQNCHHTGTNEAATADEPTTTWSLKELWRSDTLLVTCESVLYDPSQKLLFVACINGAPAEKNGLGYISLLNPGGTINTLHWVTGLNAPKGMGIYGDLLYVTDIDQLVIIDIRQADISERIDIEGASFLNDLSIGSDGRVYFSDSETGYIWIFSDGEAKPWITEGLEGPNGLFVEESRVLLTSSGSSDLKVIDRATGVFKTVTDEIGQGDGVEFTGMDGYYLTSDWTGEVFLIFPDYSKVSLLKTSGQEINSADIGFNRADKIVYVPTFFDNRVVAYKLEQSQ